MNNIYKVKSKGGNLYYVDIEKRLIQLVHPNMLECNIDKLSNVDQEYYNSKIGYWTKYNIFEDENIDYKCDAYNGDFVKDCFLNASQIVFEITDKCNLHCKYCAFGDLYNNYDLRSNKNADIDASKFFMNYYYRMCLDYGIVGKKLNVGFYGGEPLVNFDFIKSIVSYVKYLNSFYGIDNDLSYNMTTNAVLLDRYLDYFVENDFNILISLDGDKYSSSYRVDHNQKEVFEKVVGNVNLLRNKYPDYYCNKVNFNAVLHDRNSYDLVSSFFQNEFDKIPSISPLNPTGIDDTNSDLYRKMYNSNISNSDDILIWKDYLRLDPQIYSIAKFVNQYKYSTYYDYLDLLSEDNLRAIVPTGTCLPFGKKIYITVNGKILPCERVGHDFVLGKVENNSISLDFDKIAKSYKDLYQKIFISHCSSCQSIKNCVSCLFHMKTDKCDSYMKVNDMLLYLKNKIDFLETRRDDLLYLDKINIKY